MEKKIEDYFFDQEENRENKKYLVLIIYDIIDNKRRIKFAKFLEGYGFRIQKSAFEALLTKKQYENIIQRIESYVSNEDSVRTYKLRGYGEVCTWGQEKRLDNEEVIIF